MSQPETPSPFDHAVQLQADLSRTQLDLYAWRSLVHERARAEAVATRARHDAQQTLRQLEETEARQIKELKGALDAVLPPSEHE